MKFTVSRWLLILLLSAFSLPALADARTIHVLVALCDNRYQGIVPVPAALGDGQDPRSNLYWGAAYGIRTFFDRQNDWKAVSTLDTVGGAILERRIWRHASGDVWLVADAYDGRYIRQTTQDLFDYSAGQRPVQIKVDDRELGIGGKADLLIYVGHNGLMDFRLEPSQQERSPQPGRQAAVFACKSQQYFSDPLSHLGIHPAILTTQLMAPEAYVVHALADAWIRGLSAKETHLKVATAYSRYQKLPAPARRLFTTRFSE